MSPSIFRRHDEGGSRARSRLQDKCLAWMNRHGRFLGNSRDLVEAADPIHLLPQWLLRLLQSPKTTPGHFESALLDNSHKLGISEAVDSNHDSLILRRLPTEIRLLIYEYVFSSHTTLVSFRKISAHLKHEYPPEHVRDSHAWSCSPFVEHADMALLRTCRQIYLEGLGTAMTSSLFFLHGPLSQFNICRRLLPPQPLGLISHLDIQWVFCETGLEAVPGHYYTETDGAAWIYIWATVAAMRRLKSLGIALVYAGSRDQLRSDAMWLLPLRPIRGIKFLKIDIRYFRSQGKAENILNGELYKNMIAENRPPYAPPDDVNIWG